MRSKNARQVVTHRRKLEQAEVHFERFKRSVRRFLAKEPYHAVGQYEVATSEYVHRAYQVLDPPGDWAEIVGDCIHNVRSSLDHLVWSLTKLTTTKPKKPKMIGFPIFTDPADRHTWKWDVAIGQAPSEAQAIVERLQPYHGFDGLGPELHPLAVLKMLDDIDKHRSLHFIGALTKQVDVLFRSLSPEYRFRARDNTTEIGSFYDGAEIARCKVIPYDRRKMYVELRATFEIAFADEGPTHGLPALFGLTRLHDYVRDTVFPPLEKILEGHSAPPP